MESSDSHFEKRRDRLFIIDDTGRVHFAARGETKHKEIAQRLGLPKHRILGGERADEYSQTIYSASADYGPYNENELRAILGGSWKIKEPYSELGDD